MKTLLSFPLIVGALAVLAPFARAGDDGTGVEAGGPAKAAPSPDAADDVLFLKDGREIHGRITGEDDAGYAVKVGGAIRVVEKSTVKEVRRAAPAAAGESTGGDAAPAPPAPGSKGEKGDKKDREARREKRREKMEGAIPADGMPADPKGGDAMEVPPLTDDAAGWARSCIERLSANDAAVQRSAAEAIRALGPAALPLLKDARQNADERVRAWIDKVSSQISNPYRPGQGGKLDRGPGAVPPGKALPGNTPSEKGIALMERVRTEFNLDEAANRTVGGKLVDFGRNVRETMQDARDGIITYEDARTKVAEQRSKLRDALKDILTPEQVTRLDAMLDAQFAQGRGKAPPPPAPANPPAPAPAK